MRKIRVTVWNEFTDREKTGIVHEIYPDGIHECLRQALAADELEIRTATLNQPEQGLPDEVLNTTDVLVWWGHCAHEQVSDALVDKIQNRVLSGMGLVLLHSAHMSKIFRRMLGTRCRLNWREIGEKERVWVVKPEHPIAQGIPETFVVPHTEMYGEPFDIPDDGKIIFMSWYEGGNVFRSGVAFHRDNGKIFYFAPGHETYPIYHDPVIQKIIGNAVRWAAPLQIFPERVTKRPEPLELVTTKKLFEKKNCSII